MQTQKQKKSYLGLAILIAMVLGIVAGILLQGHSDITGKYIAPIGTIYLNLLKMMIVPVVLFSIVDGVISLGSVRKVGSIGWKTVVFFIGTTALAIVIGLASALIFRGSFPTDVQAVADYTPPEKMDFIGQIVKIFPSNIIDPMLNSTMLPIILIALLFGVGILLSDKDGNRIGRGVHSLNTVILKVLEMIMWVTPIGVFCIMTNLVASKGASILGALGIVILAAYVAYIIHMVLVYGVTLATVARVSPIEFLKKMNPAMTTAFTTTSSNATLPITMECTNELGCDKEVSAFVLPLGCTINMDGAAIYMGVATVFLAQYHGIALSVGDLLMVILTATLASVGSAGVPGAAMVLLAMVLSSVGIPIESIALIYGVDKIFDMGRTLLNVTGDSVCALAVDRIEKTRRAKKEQKQNQ